MTPETASAEQIKGMIVVGFQNFEAGTHFSYKTLGGLLAQMREGKKYRDIGYKNMNAFLADLGVSRTIAYSMLDYNDHVVPMLDERPELTKISVTSLCKELMPLIRLGAINTEKLCELSALSDTDQKDEIRRLRGKKTHVDCEHPDDQREGWYRCGCCGKFFKA